MLLVVVELLDVYFETLSEANFEQFQQALDTLVEFLQGPCFSN